MSARIVLEGLEDLRKAIRNIPRELRDEGKDIVREAAEAAATELRNVYPTGPLRDGVKVDYSENSISITARVRSTARIGNTDLAAVWEYGTQNRRTQQGWKRGAGPAHPDRGVIGIAKRQRKAMYPRFTPLLERLGFDVQGSAFD